MATTPAQFRDLSAIRRAVESGAAGGVIDLLGWGTEDAHSLPCPGVPALERLYLGSYPTRATVAVRTDSRTDADSIAYFSGNRWCLSARDGVLHWTDFSAGNSWNCRAGDLADDALVGFTPDAFAQVGRFEPGAGPLTPTQRRKDAVEYLRDQTQAWWLEWIKNHAPTHDVDHERDRFVSALSALVLVKTIEDLDRIAWLRPGSLFAASKRGRELPQLMQRCAEALNSRVLRGVDALDDVKLALPLMRAIEESEIDFASLEIDPVGDFYEEMLGKSHHVSDPAQPLLPSFGRGRDVAEDTSARRRLGAFFTPRSYADVLARRLVLPQMRIAETVKDLPAILDPTAGTGSLLCAALREIFSEDTWRRPEVAHHVLTEKVWAIDQNRHAVRLAALNVLRNTIMLVPELLNEGRRFPPLDVNFIVGDARQQSVLDQVPTVDVVLLNPPFKGHRQWTVPTDGDAATALKALPGPSNLAFAFLAIALDKVREGGGVGAVMTSQLFSGVQHRSVREHIARSLRVETLVENFGAPFVDALSYAGIVMGHKLQGCQLPRTEVITLPGGLRNGAADFGASLFAAMRDRSNVPEARATTRWVGIHAAALGDWTTTPGPVKSRTASRAPRVALRDLLPGGLHQGVAAAPEPWKYSLFLFREVEGGVVHSGGIKRLDDRTPTLRAFARPKWLQGRVANLCEPVVLGHKVFLPGNGDPSGVAMARLREIDPAGYALAEAIRSHAQKSSRDALSDRAMQFLHDLRGGRIRFNWSKGYVDQATPQVIFSQANRSPVGRGRGVLWSAWPNLDGAVVPLEGNHARTRSADDAIVIATLLNVPAAIDSVLSRAPARNMGTTKPELSVLAEHWRVPDITAGVYQSPLSELVDAFHTYRSASRGMTPAEAHASRAYQDVIAAGEALWRL